jgi:uncharacterized membrane protein YoaK (UPF0700 family)
VNTDQDLDERERTTTLPPMLIALTFATGIIDAVSFLGLGRVFTANMTGNVVLLGLAFGGAPGFSAGRSLLALGGFGLGAVLAGRLARWLEARRGLWLSVAFGGEAALVIVAACLALGSGSAAHGARRTVLILLLGTAMGIRNVTARWLKVPDLSTTVLTTTLTRLVADSRLAGGDGERSAWRIAAAVAMALGAVLGAVMVRHGLFGPLLVAAALVVATQGGYLLLRGRSA